MKEKIVKFFIEWGKISFDGSSLQDIIFTQGDVKSRNYDLLEKKYGTMHVVDMDEAKELLKGNPLEVVIGTGFDGGLKLTPDAEAILKQRTALFVLTSPQAVERINEMLAKNEKVSALIHVTC
ncbi:MAG: hypothetical protein WC821_04930 [archaeon]